MSAGIALIVVCASDGRRFKLKVSSCAILRDTEFAAGISWFPAWLCARLEWPDANRCRGQTAFQERRCVAVAVVSGFVKALVQSRRLAAANSSNERERVILPNTMWCRRTLVSVMGNVGGPNVAGEECKSVARE